MSPEVFQRGIRQYMETHRWGTATYEDLLSALSEASGRDVSTPFRTFLFQPGLPFVEAELSCSEGEGEEAGGAEVRFSQQRYLPVGSEGDAEQMWVMPICVRYEGAEGTEEHQGGAVGTGSGLCVCWLPGDRFLAVGTKEGQVLVCSLASGEVLQNVGKVSAWDD